MQWWQVVERLPYAHNRLSAHCAESPIYEGKFIDQISEGVMRKKAGNQPSSHPLPLYPNSTLIDCTAANSHFNSWWGSEQGK